LTRQPKPASPLIYPSLEETVANIAADSHLDLDDGVTMDTSPGARGNNSLDFARVYGDSQFQIYDGHGYATNPVTGQQYAPRLVAEF
jgi:hypothetical protein